MAVDGWLVADSDMHVMEPADLWQRYMDPRWEHAIPVGLEEIESFVGEVPRHVCVILDEAYCEFSLMLGDTYASLELLKKHTNLVILRTFSKVYGLAGMRVGYALCGSPEFRTAEYWST